MYIIKYVIRTLYVINDFLEDKSQYNVIGSEMLNDKKTDLASRVLMKILLNTFINH